MERKKRDKKERKKETNQGTGPLEIKKKKENEKETNQGTGPMELDGGGDRVRSYVHLLQLLNHHHAVVGRVCQHQLNIYLFQHQLNIYLLLEFLI